MRLGREDGCKGPRDCWRHVYCMSGQPAQQTAGPMTTSRACITTCLWSTQAPEVLFTPSLVDHEGAGMAEMVFSCIQVAPMLNTSPRLPRLGSAADEGGVGSNFNLQGCALQDIDVDNRKRLYEAVMLSGGSTMFPGLPTRLERDVRQLYLDRVLKVLQPRLPPRLRSQSTLFFVYARAWVTCSSSGDSKQLTLAAACPQPDSELSPLSMVYTHHGKARLPGSL